MTRWSRLLGGAAAVVLAGGVAACGNEETGGGGGGGGAAPGVTESTVKVGGHFPLTGPAAPGYSQIPVAIQAYFDFVNAKGGVNGRKLEFVARDDAYNPTNTVKVTRQLVLQDKVLAVVGGLGTPTHSKVLGYLDAQKVPDLFVSSGSLAWDQPQKYPQTFGWLPEYTVEGKILGEQINDRFAGRKVGVLYQDDDFGEDGRKGLEQTLDAGVVAAEAYQPGGTDLGPQISALKRAGAEVVVLFTIPTYTALAHLAALELRYQPQFVATSVGGDPTTVGGLLENFSKGKAGGQLLEGMVSDFYLPAPEDRSNSWIELFRQVHGQYAKQIPFDGSTLYGFGLAYTFVQALQAAGENPTREGLLKVLESGELRGGPTLAPFRYSADSHAGVTGVQMGEIRDGKLVLEGPVLTTDDGSEPVEESSEPPSEAPAEGVPPTGGT